MSDPKFLENKCYNTLMNKNIIIGGLVVIVLVLLGVSFINKPQTSQTNEPVADTGKPTGTTPTAPTKEGPKPKPPGTVTKAPVPAPTAGSGRVVFAITDAAVNITDIKSIVVTVTEIKIHSPSKGWVIVPINAKKIDLLELRRSGSLGFLTETNLAKETYDQLWISIKDVNVTKFDTSTGIAKLPSETIRFPITAKIEKGDTVAVVFDFDVDKSLHITGSGTYIFLPYLKISTQTNVITQIRNSGQILIGGGANYISREVGMDENGDIAENFYLRPNTDIDLIGSIIKIKRSDINETGLVVSANKAIEIATTSGFDKIFSIELKDKNGSAYWEITGTKKSIRTTIYIDPANGSIIQF